MSRFQTDALRPSALPSASLGRPRPLTRAEPDVEGIPSGDVERDRAHAEWNARIDREIKGVANGLKEIVELADIGPTPLPHANQLTALHLKLRTSQLIRAAQTLRDTAHELKLMLLLSDEVDTATRRDREMSEVRRDRRLGRARVARELGGLLGGNGEIGEDGEGSEEGGERGRGRGREEGGTRAGRDEDRDREERQVESIQGDEVDETDELGEVGGAGEDVGGEASGAGEGEDAGPAHAGEEYQPDSMMDETHRPDQNDQADEDLIEVTEPPANLQSGGDGVAQAQSEHAAGGVAEEPERRATEGEVGVEGDRSMELDEDDDLFEEVTA